MNQPTSNYMNGQQGYVPNLMEAFSFTAEDLYANRNGTATEKQLLQIKAMRGQWLVQLMLIIGIVIIFAVVFILVTPRGEAIRQVVTENPTIAVVGVGGTILFYGLMLAYAFIKSRQMSGRKVKMTSGPFSLKGQPLQALGGTIYQRIRIGRRDFMITDHQARAFVVGAHYTVYFTGGGQMSQIVSAEQVAGY